MIKYRILGILLIASTVIIILPFFQKNKLDSTDIAIAKTPAFPDQTIPATTVDAPPMPVIAEIDDANTVPTEKTSSNLTATIPTTVETNATAAPITTVAPATTTIQQASVTQFDKNGLLKLKEPTWVIQVGQFNDHTRALQMARRLSENGYRVLMQHYRAARLTKLFVQPDNQATAAYQTAQNLQDHIHLQHLIVMRYQPF